MTNLLKICVFTIAVLSVSVANLELKLTSQEYYTKELPNFNLTCGDNQWNNKTVVSIFQAGEIIFNSSEPANKYKLASGNKDNKTVTIFGTNKSGGWPNLSCAVNKIKSQNTKTVPFLSGPVFDYPNGEFKLKKNYTLTCKGDIKPAQKFVISFQLDGKSFATFEGTKFTNLKPEGLNVAPVAKTNNSITIVPTSNKSRGIYKCLFSFNLTTNKQTNVQSKEWKAGNSSAGLFASVFFVLFVTFSNALFF